MSSMLIPPAILMGIKVLGINTEDPANVTMFRVFFALSAAFTLGLLFFVKMKINSANDQQEVQAPESMGMMAKAQQQAEEAQAKKENRPYRPSVALRKMTANAYDNEQLQALVKSTLVGLAISAIIHYKWAFTVPLIIQGVMLPMKTMANALVKVHVRGETVKRPFPEEDPMAGLKAMMGGAPAAAPVETKSKRSKKAN